MTTWLRIIGRGIALALLFLLWVGVLAAIFWVVPQSPRSTIPASDQVLAGLSPDGKTLVTMVEGIPGVSGGPIIIWNAETGEKRGVIGDKKNQFGTILRFSPDDKLFAVREIKDYPNEELTLFDVATLAKLTSVNVQTVVSRKPRICFSPDARLIAFNTKENDKDCVKVWDISTRQEVCTIQGGDPPLFFFPDGKTVVIQREVKIEPYDIQNVQARFRWLDDLDIEDLSSDGKLVATTTLSEIDRRLRQWDRRHRARAAAAVQVWDAASQKQIAAFENESQPRFVSDGRLVTEHFEPALLEHHIRLWDLPGGEQIADLRVASGRYSSIETMKAFSGTSFLAVRVENHLSLFGLTPPGLDETRIYDTSMGNELRRVARWFGYINKFEVSADGTTLAMESHDKGDFSVQIWDIPTRKSIKWILGLLAVPTFLTVLTVWRLWPRKPRRSQQASKVAGAG